MADDDTSAGGAVAETGGNAGTDAGAGFDTGNATSVADTDTPSPGPDGIAGLMDGESPGGTGTQELDPWVSTFPDGTQLTVHPDGSYSLRAAINGQGNAPEADSGDDPNAPPAWLDLRPLSWDKSRGYLALCEARRNQQVEYEMRAAGFTCCRYRWSFTFG